MGECDQSNFCFSEGFRTLYYMFSGSKFTHSIYCGHKCFLRIKYLKNSILDAIILKQTRRSATKVIYVFVTLLECLYFVQLYFFWK